MESPALSIKLRCASWHQLSIIYKRDLSRNTLFLKTQSPPPVGTAVRIDLTLPSETTVAMLGEVSGHVAASDSRGAGIDVRLAPLAPNSLWLIESALASEAKLREGSKSESGVAPLADRHEVGHAEGELVSALGAEIESLRRLNPFQILGLGYEASDTEVRAAFAELTKRYHPDRFARYQSTEPRRLAAEIFILIRDAYRKLGDAQTRAATLAGIGQNGDPRAIPVLRTSSVAVARPQPSQGLVRAEIPAVRPRDGSLSPLPQSGSAASPAGSGSSPRPLGSPAPRGSTASMPGHRAVTDVEIDTIEQLLDAGALDEAFAAFRGLSRKAPSDRYVRAGLELCEGLMALAAKDRLEAAQRFEAVLEIDPSNERAARQLAEMRRQATNERKGLLSRLMGKKE